VTTAYYGELWRNQGLIRRGLQRARKYHPEARVIVGGGAVSVFYEQLKTKLPTGTIVSVGEGETLLEKFLSGRDFSDERCYVVGETTPRPRLIHESPTPLEKSACNYDYIASIWPEFSYYFQENDFYIGVQTKRGFPITAATASIPLSKAKKYALIPPMK